LRELGRYGDRLIVLIAEQRMNLGEHGVFCNHWSVYEGTQRVPLVVKPPRRPELAGTTRSELVTNVDLAPTPADYAEIDALDGWHGQSSRPPMEGSVPRNEWRDHVVLSYGV
jgi:arylsulfatase A-like enzyme